MIFYLILIPALAYVCIIALGAISLYKYGRALSAAIAHPRAVYGDTWQLPATSRLRTYRPERRYPR